jgi:hypothetical protein
MVHCNDLLHYLYFLRHILFCNDDLYSFDSNIFPCTIYMCTLLYFALISCQIGVIWMSWMLGKLARGGAGEACHALDTCYVGFCTETVC